MRATNPTAFAKRLLIAAVSLASLGLALICVVSWMPIWPLALFEHFRVQYVEVGVVIASVAAVLRVRGYFDLALVSTLIHALPVVTDMTSSPAPTPQHGIQLRVLVLNVHTENTRYERVRQLIVDEHPDVIGLVEVDQRWLDEIAPAVANYEGRIEAPRPDNFGVALYVRGEVTGSAKALATPLPTIVASVRVQATPFDVVVTHPLPPMSGAAIEEEREQFDEVAAHVQRIAGPVIVMGDFNATPWSRPFRRLVQRSGLCDTRAGFGIQASFPAASRLLRIPIDHVLVSCSIGVRDRRIGPDVASDHLPVIADLVLPR